MKIPEIEIILYRFSLRMGAIFLGWLGVIGGSIGFIILFDKIFNNYWEDNPDLVRCGIAILSLNCAIIFIISSYLLNGVYQKIEKNVKIYLYGIVITLILSILGNFLILGGYGFYLNEPRERQILMFIGLHIGKKV